LETRQVTETATAQETISTTLPGGAKIPPPCSSHPKAAFREEDGSSLSEASREALGALSRGLSHAVSTESDLGIGASSKRGLTILARTLMDGIMQHRISESDFITVMRGPIYSVLLGATLKP
jgi:hypothetical protein